MPGRVEVRGKGNASCAVCGGGFVALPQAFAALKKAGVDGGRLQEILSKDGRKIRNCVTCNQMFTSFPIQGEVLHACVPCGGFWVDKGTVDRLTGVSKEPPPPSPMSLRPEAPVAKVEIAKVEAPRASTSQEGPSVLVEDIAPLPSAPPPSAGLIAEEPPMPKPARSNPENRPSAQTVMMIASSLDPPVSPGSSSRSPSGARGMSLDPAMPAPGTSKPSSSPKVHAPAPAADARAAEPPQRKREITKDAPKKDAKKEPRAARIVIQEGGLGTAGKLGIAALIVIVVVLAVALRNAKGESPATVLGGGRTVHFESAVEPAPLALSGGAVTRFSQNKDGNFLEAVYMPVLPEGKGIDVVIRELYGEKLSVPGGVKVAGILHMRGAGDLSRDKGGPMPGRFEAFIADREGWILAAYGDPGYADSAEAQKFFASFAAQN
jgi:hypothetical protein